MNTLPIKPQRHRWLPYCLLVTLLWTAASTTVRAVPAAPNALTPPTNVACRPYEGRTSYVQIEWKDTNDDAAGYQIYRRQLGLTDWGGSIATVNSSGDDGQWLYIDLDANQSTIYQYGVTAFTDEEETAIGPNEFCREPLWLDGTGGNYRMFYRLADCPDYDEKQVCTENINDGSGQNKHVVQMLTTSEAYRTLYMDSGFNDPAFYKGDKPFPLDFFPCNNGCANSQGVQYPPAKFEEADYDPVTGSGKQYEVMVAGHEIFHKVQGAHGGGGADPFYTWVMEGQARAVEDKFCIFGATPGACAIWDQVPDSGFVNQIQNYLGKPENGLQAQGEVNGIEKYGYNAALFWTYIMEQFTTMSAEPAAGIDVILKYWQKNQENDAKKDGITTLDEALADPDLFTTDRRFKDIFQDFAVANYAKAYITNPPPAGLEKYNYKDDEAPGVDWGLVKRTVAQPLGPTDSLLGTTAVDAWGVRYFEIDPDPAVAAVHLEIRPLPATPHDLYFHLLLIDNNQIVDMSWAEGADFDFTVDNSPNYDRIALVVVGLENAVNFDYGVNLADGLYILSPNAQFPEAVGDANAPQKFLTWLQVLDTDKQPVAGIDPADFTVTVSNTVIHPPPQGAEDALINWFYSGGRYTLVLRAPPNPGCTSCPLTIQYAGYSDTEADALLYGPQPGVDNQIIIDRSFSMNGPKFDAAKGQAKVYVDSYDPGDKIGIIAYNSAPQSVFDLTAWTDQSRLQAQTALDTLPAPNGNTAIGAALRLGMQELVDQASPNPLWNMVLLSDGKDTVEDLNDHIMQFLGEYKKRKDNGDPVPVIDVIAVGDDADGVALNQVSDAAGGEFQFLPEPSEALAAGVTALTPAAHSLQLAEIYRVFAEGALGEQQIYAAQDAITNAQSKTHIVKVDGSASQGIFTVAYVYTDCGLPINVVVRRPDGTALGLPTLSAPRHLLWRVASPGAGDWKVEVSPIIPGVVAAAPAACTPDSIPRTDFLVEAALVSDVTLDAFLGLLPEERFAGKAMPVFALLSDHQPLPGATVHATSERTGEMVQLFDDGAHNDGTANDGVYGGLLLDTFQPGGYPVLVSATGVSPLNGAYTRRARLSFFLTRGDDGDNDKLPDWWEGLFPCLDPHQPDATNVDADQDGLVNAQEFFNHTNPCDPDTDDGGESDGSEVQNSRNPLQPADDFSRPPVGVAWPSAGKVILRMNTAANAPKLTIYRAPSPTGPFTLLATDVISPTWFDSGVSNDIQYCYRITATGRSTSAPSAITCTTPRADPFAPHGELFLPPGMGAVVPPTVNLVIEAYDNPTTEEHPVFDGGLFTRAKQTEVQTMQLSARSDFADATWEPYQTSRAWTFQPHATGQATVFVRFKDGAGNISKTAGLTVQVDPNLTPSQQLFLPLIRR